MPATAATSTSSQIAAVACSGSNSRHMTTWAMLPTTSLPRISLRRPVVDDTISAVPNTPSRIRPDWEADRPRLPSSHCVYPYKKAYETM
jgi:hypothetical protein